MFLWITGLFVSLVSLVALPLLEVSPAIMGGTVGVVTRCLLWSSYSDASVWGRSTRALFVVSYAVLFSVVSTRHMDFLLAVIAYAFLFDDVLLQTAVSIIEKWKGQRHENV